VRLVVVGAGPAGIGASLQARERGAEVTLLEVERAGGTSLNRGRAPVRTLARAARLMRDWSSWSTFGLQGDPPRPDLPAVLANSTRVARHTHEKKDLAGHLAAAAWTWSRAWARSVSPTRTCSGPATAAAGGRTAYLRSRRRERPVHGSKTARLEGRLAAINAVEGPTRQAAYDVVPTASFTDPEYGSVGLTEAEAAARHDCLVGVAHYEDLLRPITDGRPEGFSKLIVDRHRHTVLGGT
jgi:pyruvate/2-oxoglutarate dehydrogenase complex dihydrolipoamide dehydrogenase (E3) component